MLRFNPYNRRASTLLETIIALFVIAGSLMVVGGIYASTMTTQADDVEASTLVTVAESRLAELRALGSQLADYQNLDAQSGTVQLPDPPGYRLVTAVATTTVPYPCSGLRVRDYITSYKRVTVTATSPRGRAFSLSSLIGEPRHEAEEVIVTQTSGGSPLARDAQADFVAQLDGSAGAIGDVAFRFYIDFGRGYGRLVEDPDGRTVHFFNHILNLAGPNIYTGNEISVVARTFYAGEEFRGVSPALNLQP